MVVWLMCRGIQTTTSTGGRCLGLLYIFAITMDARLHTQRQQQRSLCCPVMVQVQGQQQVHRQAKVQRWRSLLDLGLVLTPW